MSSQTRSRVMSRIRGKETGPELLLAAEMKLLGLTWEEHARDLPGRPDFVLRDAKIAIFVDGDFWHGYRFSEWRDKLSEAWEAKIGANIKRDIWNRAALRNVGWQVSRVWEHQVTARPTATAHRILRALEKQRKLVTVAL